MNKKKVDKGTGTKYFCFGNISVFSVKLTHIFHKSEFETVRIIALKIGMCIGYTKYL